MNGQSINIVCQLFVVAITYYFMQTLKSPHDSSLQQSFISVVFAQKRRETPSKKASLIRSLVSFVFCETSSRVKIMRDQ